MKIIVLVPVKNEEWILEKFLTITSLFADHIIILDQNSTDKSKEIATGFDKVLLFENKNANFNEAERQKKLIELARDLFGIGNFLLAIDADEIIRADSLHSNQWQIIKDAPLGTIFKFDKPTPLFGKPIALTYGNGFPLGYKDDGAEHKATEIHSTRIPTPEYAKVISLDEIGFLHLCFARSNIQFSKNRYYCVLEHLKGTKSLRLRWLIYGRYQPKDYYNDSTIISENPNWYFDFEKMGIDLKRFEEEKYYYMDFEVLKILQQYGIQKFLKEPIWQFDWEECRIEAIKRKVPFVLDIPFSYPNKFHTLIYYVIFQKINTLIQIKRNVFKPNRLQ